MGLHVNIFNPILQIGYGELLCNIVGIVSVLTSMVSPLCDTA
jgi:hypothetical protein